MSVLIISGWLTSTKYIERIRKLYQELGYSDISVFEYPLLKSINHYSYQYQLPYDFDYYSQGKAAYDVAHVISGGYFVYLGLLNYHSMFECEKVVFDSVPALPKAKGASSALRTLTGLPKCFTDKIAKQLQNHWDTNKDFFERAYRKMNHDSQNKMISIIGDNDFLTNENDIHSIFPNIPIVMIQNAKHLESFKVDPEKYKETIRHFLLYRNNQSKL